MKGLLNIQHSTYSKKLLKGKQLLKQKIMTRDYSNNKFEKENSLTISKQLLKNYCNKSFLFLKI